MPHGHYRASTRVSTGHAESVRYELVRMLTHGGSGKLGRLSICPRAGDVILKIDDTHVANPADISGQLRTLRGKSAPVLLMRDHKETTVTVAISDDDPAGRIQITPFEMHPKPEQPNRRG